MSVSEQMRVRVKRVVATAVLPTRSHDTDSGYDLYASESFVVHPGKRSLVGTGLALELPPGTEGQIRPRSGLALKHGVSVLNSPGTVDEGYRGEVKVILVNHGTLAFQGRRGTRIAQLIIQQRLETELVEVSALKGSARGQHGFGSSGA